MEKLNNTKIYDTLQQHFGFTDFRPGQLEAITALMTHGRLLCIQPTGHGKSLLYQLPALLLGGLTLVISPLLALMRDQVDQLEKRFKISAASINTDQTEAENHLIRKAVLDGHIKILFIAPEQLDNLARFEFLLNLPISLLVIDEAHCISAWGHDFRPSYRQIIQLTNALADKNPSIKMLGLTATANEKTELDIKAQFTLSMQNILVHRESMDRPNIRLNVIPASSMIEKLAILTNLLPTLNGSGLIYCATRENTELVAEYLLTQNIPSIAYHAGLDIQEKRRIQADFINDHYPVITATNALGMGIDKSNLRFVIHFDFPGSITAYYQEVGRAGRDGKPADGILLYDTNDKRIHQHFIESAQPTLEEFNHVLAVIKTTTNPLNLTALKRMTGLHPTKLTVITIELCDQQFIKKIIYNGLQSYTATKKADSPNISRYDLLRSNKYRELKAMQLYADQSSECLMLVLRKALGDKGSNTCGQCSTCSSMPLFKFDDINLELAISSWLSRRTVPITLAKKIGNTITGMAVLDGKLRSREFKQFMINRTNTSPLLNTSDDLIHLIKLCLSDLRRLHTFSAIIPIPTRTWRSQKTILQLFANYLNVPIMTDYLSWQSLPDSRQGELLNNDQRRFNVENRMQIKSKIKPADGTILLLDDYIGSGATMNEAARVLREKNINNRIIPFTIAAVKWRLGNKGMI